MECKGSEIQSVCEGLSSYNLTKVECKGGMGDISATSLTVII